MQCISSNMKFKTVLACL